MKTAELLDIPNMDCFVDPSEVDEVAENLRQARAVVDTAIKYAVYKAAAMRHRLNGMVNNALRCEAQCDRLYAQLPESVRW